MQDEKRYFTADDVASVVGCSKSMAYRIIQQCNRELKKLGKFTIRGKVNAKYLLSKFEM